MALPAEPPKYGSWASMVSGIRRGEMGWRVYALQSALSSTGRLLDTDGNCGARTERAILQYQQQYGMVPDGIAGPRVQGGLIERISHQVHQEIQNLPDGLLRGFAEAEGANLLAATNWYTPPGGQVGVDCGVVQWRQYKPFRHDDLRKAFNCAASFRYASHILIGRIGSYDSRRPSLNPATLLRIAVLAHNAPFMSEQVVRNGKLSTPSAPATWTTKPGGGHYTHQEWMRVYPDRVMRYVTETK